MDKTELENLRRKYEGELVRVKERKNTVEAEIKTLTEKLGIDDINKVDLSKLKQETEEKLASAEKKLNELIEKYDELSK